MDTRVVPQIVDEAARALVEAGKFAGDINARMVVMEDEGCHEPVVVAVDDKGKVAVDQNATHHLRASMETPLAARDSLALARVEDLVAFVKRYKQPGTVIFADQHGSVNATRGMGFTAIADFSEKPDALGWNRHRAFVPCTISSETTEWHKDHTQLAFVKAIEEWADRVVAHGDATAGNLLIMASDLEVEEHTVVKASRDVKTGLITAQLKDGASSKTTIYGRFKLRMPIFTGRPEREVEIRLSLQKQGSSYGFSTRIHNFERLVREEFDAMSAELAEKAGVEVWQGQPPPEMPVGI